MSPAPVFVRIPGSHHPGIRLRLIPGFRDPGSVLILGQVTQYGNPYLICIAIRSFVQRLIRANTIETLIINSTIMPQKSVRTRYELQLFSYFRGNVTVSTFCSTKCRWSYVFVVERNLSKWVQRGSVPHFCVDETIYWYAYKMDPLGSWSNITLYYSMVVS